MEISTELQKFNITDVAIAELKERYMALKINGLDDKEGFDQVHEARMDVKGRRVQVTKIGKDLRAEANAYNKAVLEEEKRIIGLLEPIEDHLEKEENRIKEEKERIKNEAAEKEAARIRVRVERLFLLGMTFDGMSYNYLNISVTHDMIVKANDMQYEVFCQRIHAAKEEEERRIEEAAKQIADEIMRLKAQAEEQEAREKVLREAEAKIQAEKKAIEDAKQQEEDEKRRTAEIEQAKKEAAEKAIRDKEEAEKKAKIQAEKKAARAPDKEKLLTVAALVDGLLSPTFKTPEGIEIGEWFFKELMKLTKELRKRVGAL